ncbi:hypothetical protein SBADM41S_01646 [Streptomyces badius]
MTFKAEYIWIDGTEPTAKLRSKTKIMDGAPSGDVADLPIWGFDGSSTNQAEGHASDRVLPGTPLSGGGPADAARPDRVRLAPGPGIGPAPVRGEDPQ